MKTTIHVSSIRLLKFLTRRDIRMCGDRLILTRNQESKLFLLRFCVHVFPTKLKFSLSEIGYFLGSTKLISFLLLFCRPIRASSPLGQNLNQTYWSRAFRNLFWTYWWCFSRTASRIFSNPPGINTGARRKLD